MGAMRPQRSRSKPPHQRRSRVRGPNQTNLGTDFTTMIQALAFNGHSTSLIGDIHTVAVCQDSIIVIRRKGLVHSYIFEWRKRQGYIALKMMAIHRERGFWTCERINIFHTAPRMAFGDGTPKERTSLVMHSHPTQLLRCFGPTMEVKIIDCPFFWEQVGVGSVR
ncbi:hypothetical protein AAVH_08654 [Aphelenchoides avenae]|nr:hypothetical protein AAVH_08654 [Aphelenchus avenae]